MGELEILKAKVHNLEKMLGLLSGLLKDTLPIAYSDDLVFYMNSWAENTLTEDKLNNPIGFIDIKAQRFSGRLERLPFESESQSLFWQTGHHSFGKRERRDAFLCKEPFRPSSYNRLR